MPLSGLKVLELANILAGPLVGQFCAELGAVVTKVEQPGTGDPTRGWRLAEEPVSDDVSAYFSCANWGKRSLALDIATPAGREVTHRLARDTDVLIMGYKPGDEHKFELGYEQLRAENPGLIYLQITAYGSADTRPGFDAIIQAESGFTFLNGEADGAPTKMPVALVDLLAAHQLKEGLLLALLQRARTGRGSYLATSLLASATASLANQATNYLVAGSVPQRMGSEHPNIVPYGGCYATRDGVELVLAVGTERQFGGLLEVLEVPDQAKDPRFADNAARVRNRATVNGFLAARISEFDAATLQPALRAHKIPFGLVNDMRAVFDQPESRAQLLGDGKGLRSIALRGDIEGRVDLAPPPSLDQHGELVLRELGYDTAEMAELEASGARPSSG